VPKQLDGALAPGAADLEGGVEVFYCMEVLEDVDEDFWGKGAYWAEGGPGLLLVGML
jgi:hypothetical protein